MAVQEVFLETQWDDETTARQARDDRAAQLQSQGYLTTCENLWTVDGHRVFLVEAARMERIEPTRNEESASTRSKAESKGDRARSHQLLKRRDRPPLNYETR